MDGVEPDAGILYLHKIEEWLTQTWIFSEPDPDYRIALSSVLHASWPDPGKESRPSYFPLPSLCGHALGKVTAATTQVNAAWVLLFIASYLLDKIEDEETHHPIFKKFSPGAVANLTTGLILHSERILVELQPDKQLDAETLNIIRREFNRQALEVCAGQHLDLSVKEPSFEQLWQIVDAKSGKFFALGAYLGARLATTDEEKVAALSDLGRHLGILNQINNDIVGLGGEEETGSDLASGKLTLPSQYALLVLPPEKRAVLVQYLKNAPHDNTAEVAARQVILSAGALIYLALEAAKHRQLSAQALEQLQLDPRRSQPLSDLLHFAGSHLIARS